MLIFGGTGFIGPHFVRELRAGGHKLTLLNRGKRNPGLFPDVETLIGDRNVAGYADVLKGREWDVVVDDSGYFPAQVQASTAALKDRVQHYIYVSSISAYADLTPAGIDEDYKLASLDDPNAKEITEKNYGGLKAACEQIVEKTFGARQAVIRPTYIVGPGDHTDRFTYWPCASRAAAKCSRRARRQIRSSSSTCAISRTSRAAASSSASPAATTCAIRRARSRWATCSKPASASPRPTRNSAGRR